MKLFFNLFLTLQFIIVIFAADSVLDETENELIKSLIDYGKNLANSTERFLQEQKNLNNLDQQLVNLETILVQLETTIAKLQNQSLINQNDLNGLQHIHQLELELLQSEHLINEEILKLQQLIATITITTTTSTFPTIQPNDSDLMLARELVAVGRHTLVNYYGTKRVAIQVEIDTLQQLLTILQKNNYHTDSVTILELAVHNSKLKSLLQSIDKI